VRIRGYKSNRIIPNNCNGQRTNISYKKSPEYGAGNRQAQEVLFKSRTALRKLFNRFIDAPDPADENAKQHRTEWRENIKPEKNHNLQKTFTAENSDAGQCRNGPAGEG